MLNLADWPDPAYGEIVELDVLNDFIQQPVRHGVEVCKRVGLREKSKAVSALQIASKHTFTVLLPSLSNVPGSSQTWGSRAWILAVPALWKSSQAEGQHCFLEAGDETDTQSL